jgi:TldD protein
VNRKKFLYLTGMGFGGAMLSQIPVMGSPIAPEALLGRGIDVAVKKRMADVVLNAARSKGATYADCRIGRYLNQLSPAKIKSKTW